MCLQVLIIPINTDPHITAWWKQQEKTKIASLKTYFVYSELL